MITYVDLFFPANGPSASEVADRLRDRVGLTFIRGTHDLCFRWERFEQFEDWIERIHRALQGTGIIYRFISMEEEPERPTEFVGWPPVHIPDTSLTRRSR